MRRSDGLCWVACQKPGDAVPACANVLDRMVHLFGVILAVCLDQGVAQHLIGALGGQTGGEAIDGRAR